MMRAGSILHMALIALSWLWRLLRTRLRRRPACMKETVSWRSTDVHVTLREVKALLTRGEVACVLRVDRNGQPRTFTLNLKSRL